MDNLKHKHREGVQLFVNKDLELEVRAVEIDGEGWLVGKDITESLGYLNSSDALKTHVDEEDKKKIAFSDYPQFGNKGAVLINESGLYSLVLSSKLPGAKKFKRWVTSDVLPSIRKHGMYATDELLDNPDLLIAAATKLKEERAARLEAEKQRDKLLHQNKLYTTSEIAKELGLSSATKLNNLLSEKKIQYKQNKTWLLYSKYSELGLVSIKQDVLDNGKIIYDRKWTGKGRDFILNLF
ncbi:phage antirepressor KilAC domain-containing protein [Clostridium sp. NSJ-49]|uniref:phage antirepressor n=1 Tax=Clostridium TaxID=1485 RepID=UPI00164A2FDB|nr:phage antirepressor KilAC domain-containing protein [Clostridium sp. NSJ-49]MBC5626845.1 phage antirepressor KilAC domain-containing protein [Clostridium sp. NSJ-49]